MNADEADKCVAIARRKLESGDVAGARKFARKAEALHDSPAVQQLLKQIDASAVGAETNGGPGAQATSSDAHAGSSSTRRRADKDAAKTGPAKREFTAEQETLVRRVRRCKHTDFYEIMDIKREATDSEVKKSYRRLALQLHPDKNGAPGADEAFKMVSRAFQILSDADKRAHFDRYGADPDSRGGGGGGGGGGAQGPMFARRGQANAFEGEMNADDLFNMFFGGAGPMGGMHAGGGGFGGSPFVSFGGPGIRVHHFGGGGPRQAGAGGGGGQGQAWMQLLPLIVIFGFSILSSLFSGLFGSGGGLFSSTPGYTYQPEAPYTSVRHTPNHKIPYYVDPTQVEKLSAAKIQQLDRQAEVSYVRTTREACEWEYQDRERRMNDAYGFFTVDKVAYEAARDMTLRNCDELRRLGYRL